MMSSSPWPGREPLHIAPERRIEMEKKRKIEMEKEGLRQEGRRQLAEEALSILNGYMDGLEIERELNKLLNKAAKMETAKAVKEGLCRTAVASGATGGREPFNSAPPAIPNLPAADIPKERECYVCGESAWGFLVTDSHKNIYFCLDHSPQLGEKQWKDRKK